MATRAQDDALKRLRTQLRDAKRKGPLRTRVELALTKGAPAYSGGLAIGYISEVYGSERGAQARAAFGLGGILALFTLNPKNGSITETVLSGATAAGMATMAQEHGETLGRYSRAKKAQVQSAQEAQARAELDGETDRETIDTETTDEQRVSA